MSESIKVRVVIEEVVVDYEACFDGKYRQFTMDEVKGIIEQTVKAALELHTQRKPADGKE